MIHPERMQTLNRLPGDAVPRRRARYVLYWMQAAQRVRDNHALTFAIRQANERRLPVVVCFGLTDGFPEANLRHYLFMLQGLQEVERELTFRDIRFVLLRRSPEQAALALAPAAALLVTDGGYLRIQKQWRVTVARQAPCPVIQVETEVVVPVAVVSPKEEYAAATLRRKILPCLDTYLQPLRETEPQHSSLKMELETDATSAHGAGDDHHRPTGPPDGEDGLPPGPPPPGLNSGGAGNSWSEGYLASLNIERSVPPVAQLRGGGTEADKLLSSFINNRLQTYREVHNDPAGDGASGLSPYLHFGQISPLTIARKVLEKRDVPREEKDAFLEELIVRRELSMNFIHYNPAYDTYEALPAWALRSLGLHAGDERPYRYAPEELEGARTHDPYWNAAQREMVITGRMQNYLRMYWGKKLLEWSATPREAFHTALYLNNKYALDGRDPNSFAGVAWCFGKHDRPWGERKIFGQIRYMNAAGLRRKFDMEKYVSRIAALGEDEKTSGKPSLPTADVD